MRRTPSQAKIAVFLWPALQRPIRAATLFERVGVIACSFQPCGWKWGTRSRDANLGDERGRCSLGHVERKQREGGRLAGGFHDPPDRMPTGVARRESALVAKRALEAAEPGEHNAAFIWFVLVVEEVAGHESRLPRCPSLHIRRAPSMTPLIAPLISRLGECSIVGRGRMR